MYRFKIYSLLLCIVLLLFFIKKKELFQNTPSTDDTITITKKRVRIPMDEEIVFD